MSVTAVHIFFPIMKEAAYHRYSYIEYLIRNGLLDRDLANEHPTET